MTTIAEVQALPASPYNGTGIAGIVITSGIPSYFRILGADLDQIVDFTWLPRNPASVVFETRKIILLNSTEGTFMVRVLNNYLDINDRGGRLCFTLSDETTLTVPVKTYGPASTGPLWTAPSQGLITG
jgi:hypothetical protein